MREKPESHERQNDHEREAINHSICIATTTSYKNWYPGEVREEAKVNKVRGDLALQMLQQAIGKGLQVVVVDGASSDLFRQALAEMGITPHDEVEKSMAGSRRQVLREAGGLSGVKVVVWTEPEKVSIARDCLPEAVQPILQGLADIVIPKRDAAAFRTYPDYQVASEQRANRLWNQILKKHHLLPEMAEDLDVWFGPRFIRNDPEVLDIFLQKYTYKKEDNSELDKLVNVEDWPNTTFLPVVDALKKGLRVVSIPVHYRHPQEQTAVEVDNDIFRRKRNVQYKTIIVSTNHLIRKIEDNSKSKLHLVGK